jgi:hypothetical protein
MAKANNMTPINNHRLRLTDIIRLTPVKRSPEEKRPSPDLRRCKEKRTYSGHLEPEEKFRM